MASRRGAKSRSRNRLSCRKPFDMSMRASMALEAATWGKGRDHEPGAMAEEARGREHQNPADDTCDSCNRQPCGPRSSAGHGGLARPGTGETCRGRFGDGLDHDEQTKGVAESDGLIGSHWFRMSAWRSADFRWNAEHFSARFLPVAGETHREPRARGSGRAFSLATAGTIPSPPRRDP